VPAGLSLRARLFILEAQRGAVNLDRLTAAQGHAADGLLARAMAGYLRWLAPRMDALHTELPVQHRALREQARRAVAGHDRTPDAAASLALGLRYLLDFAEDCGAVSADGALQTWEQGLAALNQVARTQGGYHASEDPVQRFLALLFAGLESGAFHVADASTEKAPSEPARWGWRREQDNWREQGRRIGWIDAAQPDGAQLLLSPESAYAAVQVLANRQGTTLALSQRTLWRRLNDRGLVTGDEGRNTAKAKVAGRRVRVLRLSLQHPLCSASGASGADGDNP
jgi:hypothetical protein